MKVLCIRGRPACRFTSGLKRGAVYTVASIVECACDKGFEIEETPWLVQPLSIICWKCRAAIPIGKFALFHHSRFIPLTPTDPRAVTQDEVNELYSSTTRKEKV